ncbi:MAG: hypothetical protein JWO76_2896, partial [Nocardioides sp.]|nr:hypothetical protein [Nocardioides sp.]
MMTPQPPDRRDPSVTRTVLAAAVLLAVTALGGCSRAAEPGTPSPASGNPFEALAG